MSLVLYAFYNTHSFVSRDYLNLELRHHHVLLFCFFILIDVFMFNAAKLHIFQETTNFLAFFFMNWHKKVSLAPDLQPPKGCYTLLIYSWRVDKLTSVLVDELTGVLVDKLMSEQVDK